MLFLLKLPFQRPLVASQDAAWFNTEKMLFMNISRALIKVRTCSQTRQRKNWSLWRRSFWAQILQLWGMPWKVCIVVAIHTITIGRQNSLLESLPWCHPPTRPSPLKTWGQANHWINIKVLDPAICITSLPVQVSQKPPYKHTFKNSIGKIYPVKMAQLSTFIFQVGRLVHPVSQSATTP